MINNRVKEVADPLYSTIQIPKEIVAVVDHPLVQRLRRIKQLQTVHRVYPSATHTRFEHSLGVMHLSGIFAEHLGGDVLLAMLAGLLHDVGHGPYSHTFDEVVWKNFKPGRNHERFGHELIRLTDLGETIEKHANVSAEDVVRFLRSEIKPRSYIVVNRIYPSDILDFVNRDRFYTNVDVAPVKRERLVRNTLVDGDRLKLRSKAIDTLRTLLISRRDLFAKVYFHKTSLIIDKLVRRLLSARLYYYLEVLEKALEGDYGEFLMLTDENVVLEAMKNAETRGLAKAIYARRLPLKCVYRAEFGIPEDYKNPKIVTEGLKRLLSEKLEELGIRDYEVDVRYLKNIPDNPYDEIRKIALDRGRISYRDILPDRTMYTVYIRVYVPRDLEIDEAKLESELRGVAESGETKIGITM